MDPLAMSQDGHKLERVSVRKPDIGNSGTSLKLFQSRLSVDFASFQFDRDNPIGAVLLPEEKVVATLLVCWYREY